MKVKFTLGIGLGAQQEDVIEYDDDVTDEELEEDWQGWSSNYIDGGFRRLED